MKQLDFDFLFTNPLREAIERIQKFPSATSSLSSFVFELGTNLLTNPNGSLLIAGIPDHSYVDTIVESLGDFFACEDSAGKESYGKKIAGIEIPCSMNTRAQRRQIANSYAGFPVSELKGKHKPQFALNFSNASFESDPLQNICGMISNRSADFYAVKNGHRLVSLNAKESEVVSQIRFFSQVAKDSQKTHIIFVNLGTALAWRNFFEVQTEAEFVFHRPYRDVDDQSKHLMSIGCSQFIAWLKSFDLVIPREEHFALGENFCELHQFVYGCPFRLHRWMIKAVTNAIASGQTHVSRANFVHSAPSEPEIRAARNEFLATHHEEPLWASKDGEVTKKPKKPQPKLKLKPGEMTPRRHRVDRHSKDPAA